MPHIAIAYMDKNNYVIASAFQAAVYNRLTGRNETQPQYWLTAYGPKWIDNQITEIESARGFCVNRSLDKAEREARSALITIASRYRLEIRHGEKEATEPFRLH